jgi:formylglycine-generating enzyme required for sulfatase activity
MLKLQKSHIYLVAMAVLSLLVTACMKPNNPEMKPALGATQTGEITTNSPERVNPVDQAHLVLVPAGEFTMGASLVETMLLCDTIGLVCDEVEFTDESPAHQVFLEDYLIYQHEVTNQQYRLCVENGGCTIPALTEFFNNPNFPNHPVVYVNWFAAVDYCTWAGGRLPTEAEWEKAARGISGDLYPWGNNFECGFANYDECTRGLTVEVGTFPEGASPLGVEDMAGNATEWVYDWYLEDYYSESPLKNPQGPETGEMRVARGGSWKNPLLGVRTTNRSANFPEVYSSGTGFRCVIEVGE